MGMQWQYVDRKTDRKFHPKNIDQMFTSVVYINEEVITLESNMSTQNLVETYYQYKDLLYRIAFTYVKNQADAEDVLQETFLKYFNKAPVFENNEHEKRWLIRVTINLCKNHLLSFWQRNRCEMSDQFYTELDEDEMLLIQEVMKLPAKQRGIIYLHYYEGYSCKEISKIMGIGESAVKMRLKKGREILQKSMEV